MAMIICTECNKDISDKALTCPNCGCPVVANIPSQFDNNVEIDTSIMFGDEAYNRGDYAEAFKYYTKVIEINPFDYERKFRRMLASVSAINLNEKSKIVGPISHIEEYCSNVNKDETLSSDEKQSKILIAFTQLSFLVVSIHNLAQSIYMKNTVIKSSYQSYLTICQYVVERYFEIFPKIEKEIENCQALQAVWNSACENCITILKNYSQKYTDSVYKTALFLSESGQSICYNYATIVANQKRKFNPDYKLPPNLLPTDEGGTGIKAGGCFIATAVYGTYDCPEVWLLRRYRDHTLAKSKFGRAFIKFYYAISPTIVKWFGNTKWFNSFFKSRLDSLIEKLQCEGVANTPYNDNDW